MKKITDLWLDLELRKDIDDYATLIYAIESGATINFLSVNNPSLEEIRLFNYTIEKFGLDATFVISGTITEYDESENIHPSLMKLIDGYKNINYTHIDEHKLLNFEKNRVHTRNSTILPITVFCGGSLTTLAYLLERFDNRYINAYIQGGYASYKIVEPEFLLKKFKKREKVPTWNLNLDIEATKKVLKSSIEIHFISKNICHDSWVDLADLNDGTSFFNSVLVNYFKENKYTNKCLHDLLAFLSINSDIVDFKRVDLFLTEDARPKCWSELNDKSKKSISVAFSKTRFLDKIKNL